MDELRLLLGFAIVTSGKKIFSCKDTDLSACACLSNLQNPAQGLPCSTLTLIPNLDRG